MIKRSHFTGIDSAIGEHTDPSCPREFTSLALYGFWSHVWECRQAHDLIYNGHDTPSEGLLVESRISGLAGALQNISLYNVEIQGEDPELAIISAFLSLALYTPLPALQKFLGRHGDQDAQETAPLIHDWVMSRNSRYAIYFAARVLHAGNRLTTPCLHGFNAYAVYSATLVLFCYGVIVGKGTARVLNGSSKEGKQPNPSALVWLGEDRDAAQFQIFLASGYGAPALHGVEGSLVAFVHSPRSAMAFATDIFTNKGGQALQMMPGFMESLVRIQQFLTKAVR